MSAALKIALGVQTLFIAASASGFLVTPRRSSLAGSATLDKALQQAVEGEAFGCGGDVGHEELAKIQQKLESIWRSLPKNSEGNLERRSLRYAVHRYFNREWSLHIRGLEPSRTLNASSWGSDDILAQRVPAYVESVLESSHKLVNGFTLADGVHMVAIIEQLLFDSETALLQQAYEAKGKFTSRALGQHALVEVLEFYLIKWLLALDDNSVTTMLAQDPVLIEESIPHWGQISSYLHGQIRAAEYRRRKEPEAVSAANFARPGQNAMVSRYSFEDAHRIVAGITKNFAAFWDSECLSMKAALFVMDTHHTGRVPLAKFHGRGLEADWRFGESAEYLKELGALDETSWRGKQVMIANYMQAASNCVISTQHYLVCCKNDCEGLLGEIEDALGAPTARPEEVLSVVASMNAQSTLDDDFPAPLEASIKKQLRQIAEAHGGEVPLHGRLFAQWLHYVFPRQCAFPHKAGVVKTMTPTEYGDKYYASNEEMSTHAAEANVSGIPTVLSREDVQWMSQWSEEEELIAEHGMRTPWAGAVRSLAVFLGVGVLGLVATVLRKAGGARQGQLPSLGSKQHYV